MRERSTLDVVLVAVGAALLAAGVLLSGVHPFNPMNSVGLRSV